MTATARALLVVLAAVAALVLGIVVLVSHPTNEIDLLAGGVIAVGVGLVVSVVP
jgi:hypothetical protein